MQFVAKGPSFRFSATNHCHWCSVLSISDILSNQHKFTQSELFTYIHLPVYHFAYKPLHRVSATNNNTSSIPFHTHYIGKTLSLNFISIIVFRLSSVSYWTKSVPVSCVCILYFIKGYTRLLRTNRRLSRRNIGRLCGKHNSLFIFAITCVNIFTWKQQSW